jgi:hypothetical protein
MAENNNSSSTIKTTERCRQRAWASVQFVASKKEIIVQPQSVVGRWVTERVSRLKHFGRALRRAQNDL